MHVLPEFELELDTWLAMHENLRSSPRCRVTFDALAVGLADYIKGARVFHRNSMLLA